MKRIVVIIIAVLFCFSCYKIGCSKTSKEKKKCDEFQCIKHMQVVFSELARQNENSKGIWPIHPKETLSCPITNKPYFYAFGGLQYDKITTEHTMKIPVLWDLNTSNIHKNIVVTFLGGNTAFFESYDDINGFLIDIAKKNVVQGAVLEEDIKRSNFKLKVPLSGKKKGILIFGKNIPYEWIVEEI